MEAEMFRDDKDVGSEAFVNDLLNILEDAKKVMGEKAEEFGIDLEELAQGEIDNIHETEHDFVKESELAKLAERYAWEVAPLLETDDVWDHSGENEDTVIQEVLAVVHWYRFFIAAKIERALHGIAHNDAAGQTDQLTDPQSDANGSIKTGLIAIERSILAWTYLIEESNAHRIRPLIQLLELIKCKTEEKFPRARDFVRPGFDEIDIVM